MKSSNLQWCLYTLNLYYQRNKTISGIPELLWTKFNSIWPEVMTEMYTTHCSFKIEYVTHWKWVQELMLNIIKSKIISSWERHLAILNKKKCLYKIHKRTLHHAFLLDFSYAFILFFIWERRAHTKLVGIVQYIILLRN